MPMKKFSVEVNVPTDGSYTIDVLGIYKISNAFVMVSQLLKKASSSRTDLVQSVGENAANVQPSSTITTSVMLDVPVECENWETIHYVQGVTVGKEKQYHAIQTLDELNSIISGIPSVYQKPTPSLQQTIYLNAEVPNLSYKLAFLNFYQTEIYGVEVIVGIAKLTGNPGSSKVGHSHHVSLQETVSVPANKKLPVQIYVIGGSECLNLEISEFYPISDRKEIANLIQGGKELESESAKLAKKAQEKEEIKLDRSESRVVRFRQHAFKEAKKVAKKTTTVATTQQIAEAPSVLMGLLDSLRHRRLSYMEFFKLGLGTIGVGLTGAALYTFFGRTNTVNSFTPPSFESFKSNKPG